ncbi:hypothetical protein BD413DRAFT_466254 [Trametes elegans]|nr:hypothetical protein BD413DRAFT_466254 [Trametes elegans]
MPWRVGRDFRHLYRAAHSLLERSRVPLHPLCLIVKPIHSSSAAWQPVAALKLSHSRAAASENKPDDLDDTDAPLIDDESREVAPLQGKRSTNTGAIGTAQEAHPPPAILSVINDVFKRHPAHPPKLEVLRQSSAAELLVYLRLPHRTLALVHHFLDIKEHRRAMWILDLAHMVGCDFSPIVFEQAAEKLAKAKAWRQVQHLTRIAREQLGYSTPALLHWHLHALMGCQHYLSLQDVLDLFAREQVRPSRLTYHLLISMHLRNHDFATALACVRAMESAGFHVSPRTWAVILSNHRSLGLPPSAKKQALAALQTADTQTATAILNSLVQLLLDANDTSGVVEVLSMVSQPLGGPPSDPGAGTIQDDDASTTAAENVHEHAPPGPVTIGTSTYNIILNHLSRQGDLAGSMETIQQMRGADILPDGDTLTALVRLYFASDHPNDALHIVADALKNFPAAVPLLRRLGYEPGTPARYPTFPSVATPTISLFNTLLTGVLRTCGLNSVRTVLHMMKITKVDANATTLANLMSHLHRQEHPRSREMIRAVRSLMSTGIAPTAHHLHVLMAARLREERLRAHPRGWTVQAGSERTSRDPAAAEPPSDVGASDYTHPTAGVEFARRSQSRRLMKPIIQSLTDRGVRSDRVTFALRIKHDAVIKRDLDMALATFKTMVASGIRPNEYHYGALMEGYVVAGNLQGAANVLQEAVDAGVRIDVKTHTILIAGHARQRDPAAAAEAFQNMLVAGIRPDVPAIDALVSAFFRAGAHDTARRVLLQLWPQVGAIPDELVDASLQELAVAFRAMHAPNQRGSGQMSPSRRRMLRWKIRDILQTWKGEKKGKGKGKGKGDQREKPAAEEVDRSVRPVASTRTPEYTRAKRR